MPRYYKSRYLAEPIIYVQEEHRYRTVTPDGTAAEVEGEIPQTIMSALEEMPAQEAEHLIATSYHRSGRVELSPLRQVYSYTSPLPLVARACVEALRQMGWKTSVDTSGAVIADENYKWWRAGWAGYPQRFKVTFTESDGQTLLTASHFNVGGSGRPGFLNKTIEQMAGLIDDLLRRAGNDPVTTPSS